jgi:hypothetical protein
MNYRHGYRSSPHYTRWICLNQRCYNPKDPRYADYGGRGIRVCKEWRRRAGPKAFCDWAEQHYQPGLVLDRIDFNDDYKPSNCRFVTHKESVRNRRPNKPFRKRSSFPTGVTRVGRKFMARAFKDGKQIYLGSFSSIEEAVEARRACA